MSALRVSATTLETFRRFLEPEQEYTTEDDVLTSIRRSAVETEAMRVGSAFDEVIERRAAFYVAEVDGYVHRGCCFDRSEMERDVFPLYDDRGLFQVKDQGLYGDVLVVCKADQVVGGQVIETKTTLGTFDIEKYLVSAQWRLMADILKPLYLTYRVFLLKDEHPVAVGDVHAQRYTVKGCEEFNVFPYVGLHEDCARLVGQFREWVEARGLVGELQAIQQEREAA
jgi:hypothetical protein